MRWAAAALIVFLLAVACGGSGEPSSGGAYIALGDSLSEGVGASDPATTAFVPLVHAGMGDKFELLNLGKAGDTSEDLLDGGPLDRAVAEIKQRKADGDASNDVRLVTLEIGGNDLLDLFSSLVLTGRCLDLRDALAKPAQCVEPLRQALDAYGPRLKTILGRLQEADPRVLIILMTMYNPFSGSVRVFEELGELSLEGLPDTPFPEGLNDIIRAQAQGRRCVTLVDWYPLFQGRAPQLISQDLIHPNDQGYRVMADAILDKRGGIGPALGQAC